MTPDPHAYAYQLSGISKTYPNGVQALQNIDLTLYQGEIFGIISRSGAGKSTLLRLFNRLENADSGEITIHGEQTLRYSRSQMRDLRRRVAMIFQHFNLMSTKTVAQNVELPLKMAGVPRAKDSVGSMRCWNWSASAPCAIAGRQSSPAGKSSAPGSLVRW